MCIFYLMGAALFCGYKFGYMFAFPVEPNTFIKPSGIHGLGLFAKRNIMSGEEIEQGSADYANYLNEWIEYNKTCKKKSFCFARGYCMINHSDSPNTSRLGGDYNIYATRFIKEGEEITENYHDLPDESNPFFGTSFEEYIFRAKDKK